MHGFVSKTQTLTPTNINEFTVYEILYIMYYPLWSLKLWHFEILTWESVRKSKMWNISKTATTTTTTTTT